MGAEMHQLVYPATVAIIEFTVALRGSELHDFASAVGHIDLELIGSGVGEEHLN